MLKFQRLYVRRISTCLLLLIGLASVTVLAAPSVGASPTLAKNLAASLCVEQDTQPPEVAQVESFLRDQKIKATANNATLPSGRVVVLIAGERFTIAQKTLTMKTFGSRVAIDSAFRS
jgi:hypothetical protein